ncbi:MAG: RNA polymerase sigma factor [Candidatus Acidiferrales bacterium]
MLPRAEELAQEVFLAVLRGTERWEPRAAFRTWLYGIATKMLWAERRKAAREAGAVPVSAAEAPEAVTMRAASGGTDDALAALHAARRKGRREEIGGPMGWTWAQNLTESELAGWLAGYHHDAKRRDVVPAAQPPTH